MNDDGIHPDPQIAIRTEMNTIVSIIGTYVDISTIFNYNIKASHETK